MAICNRVAAALLAVAVSACGTPLSPSDASRDGTTDAVDTVTIDSVDTSSDAGADTTDSSVDSNGDAAVDSAVDAGGDTSSSTCNACDTFTTPASGGTITNPALVEVSGVVASHAHPGVLYVHNDSGDTARFFAIDMAGNTLGEFRLAGVTAHDWEDISLGPCPSGTCVYLGDTGDNAVARTQYQVYRVAEPDVSVGSDLGVAMVPFERFPFVYPNGSHNCETLMVHPATGRVYVVTKVANGMSEVFRFPMPLTADSEATLERVTGFMVPPDGNLTTTGGDIHPCANRFLLRVYGRLYEYRIDDSLPFENVFDSMANVVPVATEPQGEAVAYLPDGRGYVTISEGTMRPVNVNGCR